MNYADVDAKPLEGVSFYRLKQTDFDGQFSYSNIVAVNLTGNNDIIIVTKPVVNELVVWGSEFGDNSMLVIFNTIGEKVFEKHQSSDVGRLTISVADFSSGIYFVQIKNNEGISTAKFIKE